MGRNKEFNGTLDEIEFPPTLYKYRDWNHPFHDRFIIEREIFLASPASFEDQMDCRNPIRYDKLTDAQAVEFYEYISRREFPHRSRKEHRKEGRIWSKKKLFKNKDWQENYVKEYNDGLNQHQGILSLTAEPCLTEMWHKYANKGKGFCIGYNSRLMFDYLGGGGNVEYYNELPIILPRPFMSYNEITQNQLFYKERKWNFEKEYRTLRFWENPASITDRQIKLPKDAFKEIILGDNISNDNRREIIQAVRKYIGDIPIREKKSVC